MDDARRDPAEEEQPAEQPPDEEAPARLAPPSKAAGGMGAIVATMRYAASQTGLARAARILAQTNQASGFDCPGCAWPEPRERDAIEFCENGAKAVLSEATTRKADADFFRRWSIADLAKQSDHWLNEQGRLTNPLVRHPGATYYEPISWDAAFDVLGRELRGLGSPNEALFYTSGRTSNEAAFIYQLFARAYGTNNLPDCSNMCHESSGTGLKDVLGVGKGTVQLEDFEIADAIFVVGQNPGTNHPRMLTALEKAAKRGATIVSVNPLAEVATMRFGHPQNPVALAGDSTPLARLHVPVRINGDVAFFHGVIKAMLESEARAPGTVVDWDFVERYTDGFEALARAIGAHEWPAIERASGVDEATIRAAARIAIDSRATIVTWAMGITQHVNAVDNVRAIVNFALLRGMVGKPGAGVCPVRGHSNVQGDRTMGIFHAMPGAWLDALGRTFGFDPPRAHGYDVVEGIRAMLDGRAKLFFGLGGNFLSAAPDTARTAEALRSCRLTAHVSTKLHRGHLVTGERGLVLPCLGRTEVDIQAGRPQFVTVEDSMSVVHASHGSLRPASAELLSETRIVARLAEATLHGNPASPPIDWSGLADDYDRLRDAIARVVPGCERYNARVREPAGFVLRNGARERDFDTSSKKARFTLQELPTTAELPPGQLLMMTIRSHDQYNTTVYGLDDRYRGIHGGRRVIFVNEDDARAMDLAQGDEVDVTSGFGSERRIARRFRVVPYRMPRGCCATYFPEGNILVPLESVARESNTPASKSVVVTLERSVS